MNPHRISAVIGKESREILRDPITLGVAILMPLVMLFLFGYAISLDLRKAALGVLDEDRTPASRALIEHLTSNESFYLGRFLNSAREIETVLQRNQVDLVLVIPSGLQESLLRQEHPDVQILVDGTYSTTALLAAGYAENLVSSYAAAPPEGRLRLETRIWYNPSLASANYVVPGLYAVILLAFPPLLTALGVVREKETGTIQSIFASPLTSSEFIIGKLVPYSLIALLQMLMVVAVGYLWFGVPFRGSFAFLVAAGLIYVFCTVGIGLLVSTLTRTQLSAMLLALIVTLMPSFLFSGLLFPIFTMPALLQLYSGIFPGRYFVEISRGIVLKGIGIDIALTQVTVLAVYTLAVFFLASWRLRKKVA
ncbi:membrane protein [Marinobacterium zhoushanense]|uniref:Membrane protein n=1 Tax=Marinobacterium zhoushanense TaxID=1679163 RepID=A0ABQ1KB46_9GAMM|nr:ABC transporter permease [Marinobacterium zhoushanense]GGB92444.1 membrane protein [Marinobacterium zhoushanense]